MVNNMFDNFQEFIISNRLFSPIIIIVASIVIYNVIVIIVNKGITKENPNLELKKRNTLIELFKSVSKYIIIFIAFVLILNVYEIDTTSFITGLGIAGIVIGLALQDAIKDIIGGINIILENYYVIGDIVKFGDFTGTVIEFGLKSTKIHAKSGEVLIVANRKVDQIINLSQKKATVTVEVPTSHEASSKKVKKVLEKVLIEIKKLDDVEASGCEYLGVDRTDAKSVIYTFRIKCEAGRENHFRRIALELVKEAYDQEGLKFG